MKNKKSFRMIFAVVVIGMLVFSPFLLVIDYKRFGPFVLLFWVMSIAYFLFLKKKVDRFYGLTGSKDEDSNLGPAVEPDESDGKKESKDESGEAPVDEKDNNKKK